MHAKFGCDECDKVFRYEQILEKHKEAEHEDVQLFCHYYNDEKECPFEDNYGYAQIQKNANLEVIVKEICVSLSMKIWLLRLVIVRMILMMMTII